MNKETLAEIERIKQHHKDRLNNTSALERSKELESAVTDISQIFYDYDLTMAEIYAVCACAVNHSEFDIMKKALQLGL